MTTLIDQLRPHIEALGQAETARRAGMHAPHVSAWLSGRRPLSLERQIRLAEAIGLRVRVSVTKPNRRTRV